MATNNDALEQKVLSTFLSDIKATGSKESGEMAFSGYGAYFNNVDSYGDIIVPGAFKSSIIKAKKTNDYPVMLAQHGMDGFMPIGVFTYMEEDEKGLYVEGKLADTELGRDYYALLKMQPRPAIKGMSIGYRTRQAEYRANSRTVKKSEWPDGAERKLLDIDLHEISLVTFPANTKAVVTDVKNENQNNETNDMEFKVRDAEKALKESGYSVNEAKTIISLIKPFIGTAAKVEQLEVPQEADVKQDIQPVETSQEELSDEMKQVLDFIKDQMDPRSSGLELNEEEKSALAAWIEEEKQEEELIRLRDFIAKN